MTTVDGQRFRAVMAAVCAPVTVVTTTGADGPRGATVGSFTSLSLDPPLVGVNLLGQGGLPGRAMGSPASWPPPPKRPKWTVAGA